MIDLRSDTVTVPTPQMRQAMANADVGDDVLGEDPTVKLLEKRTAQILGKEAAVYVPSGTMSNQLAIRTHTEPGDEMLADAEAHCYLLEGGGAAALSGVSCRLIPSVRGIFDAPAVKSVLRPRDYHFAPTKLLCIENTHNRGGGSVWPLELIAGVSDVARETGLKLHLDGARLWNAAVAAGIPESRYAQYFDSVNVCFSKGLGAPVGSVLAGSVEFIERARRFRKQFGGGMRQAGIIAAGALYALENYRNRLAEDHINAKKLAYGIVALPCIELQVDTVETNIVLFRVHSVPAAQLVEKLCQNGVSVLATSADTIRVVTHLGISDKDIDEAVAIFAKVFQR